jgi:hypothetical protein
MDYSNIKTSTAMNKSVKEQLLLRDDHLSKYAAKRIEELEIVASLAYAAIRHNPEPSRSELNAYFELEKNI